jgi:hypothetical protein
MGSQTTAPAWVARNPRQKPQWQAPHGTGIIWGRRKCLLQTPQQLIIAEQILRRGTCSDKYPMSRARLQSTATPANAALPQKFLELAVRQGLDLALLDPPALEEQQSEHGEEDVPDVHLLSLVHQRYLRG